MGKLLLAYLPAHEQQTRLAAIAAMPKRATNTITSKSLLEEELSRVRASGLAVNDEELASGLVSIARGVRNEAHDDVVELPEP